MDDLNYGSVQRNTINPVSMKVFLDREEDSFLFHKVEETACCDAILPLTLPTKVGSLKVGGSSEADDHKLTGTDKMNTRKRYAICLH